MTWREEASESLGNVMVWLLRLVGFGVITLWLFVTGYVTYWVWQWVHPVGGVVMGLIFYLQTQKWWRQGWFKLDLILMLGTMAVILISVLLSVSIAILIPTCILGRFNVYLGIGFMFWAVADVIARFREAVTGRR